MYMYSSWSLSVCYTRHTDVISTNGIQEKKRFHGCVRTAGPSEPLLVSPCMDVSCSNLKWQRRADWQQPRCAVVCQTSLRWSSFKEVIFPLCKFKLFPQVGLTHPGGRCRGQKFTLSQVELRSLRFRSNLKAVQRYCTCRLPYRSETSHGWMTGFKKDLEIFIVLHSHPLGIIYYKWSKKNNNNSEAERYLHWFTLGYV